ncbi:MAG: serine hydrolase domain-containing protein [Tenuifilaceae bacterium]
MIYKKHKRLFKTAIFIVSFLVFFLVDFSSGFSLKNKNVQLTDVNNIYPDSYILTNVKSELPVYNKLDQTFQSFINNWRLASASIAIAKDGKLVYAKGFGFADKENAIEAQPFNMYRIASVSKLITASAIMKLLEEGRLTLDSKVFGSNGLLNDTIFLNYVDKRAEDITVKNLLNHTAGWSSRWGDHMFIKEKIARSIEKPLPISLQDIVVFALSKKLHFTPGSHSSYSNLGYSILQLVIEKASGKSYEDYVKQSIFDPIKVHDAFIANNYDTCRYPNEVRYYEVPEAERILSFDGKDSLVLKSRGGNDIKTLGAAGGWVISSLSLVKFLLSIDGSQNFPDILDRSSVNKLVEREGFFEPLGWRTIYPNGKWWRSGSMAGTSALAVIRNDGFTYVFITNSSPWTGSKFPYEVDRLMNRALMKVEIWPNINLFDPSNIVNPIINHWEAEINDPYLSGKLNRRIDLLSPIS